MRVKTSAEREVVHASFGFEMEDKKIVLVFSEKELDEIMQGANFLEILEQKCRELIFTP